MTLRSDTIACMVLRLLALTLLTLLAVLTSCGGGVEDDIMNAVFGPTVVIDSQGVDSPIYWTGKSQLTVAAFQGSPSFGEDIHTQAKTYTKYHGTVKIDNGVIKYNIWTEFEPGTSFIRDEWKQGDVARLAYIVGHENLHFDIAEHQLRRFKEDISKLEGTGLDDTHIQAEILYAEQQRLEYYLEDSQSKFDAAQYPLWNDLDAAIADLHQRQNSWWASLDSRAAYANDSGTINVR